MTHEICMFTMGRPYDIELSCGMLWSRRAAKVSAEK